MNEINLKYKHSVCCNFIVKLKKIFVSSKRYLKLKKVFEAQKGI